MQEEDDWKTIYNSLMESGGVTTITAEQAKAKRGAVIVDVRLANKAQNGMAAGSISIPLYQVTRGYESCMIIPSRLSLSPMLLGWNPHHPFPCFSLFIRQPIQAWDLPSTIRRAGFAFFGIYGTERNPGFIEEALAKVPKNKEVIVLCEMGGTMVNKSGTKWGFQSRSLKALHYLRKAGYSKLFHLEEGIGGWERAGLKMSYPDNP